MSSEIHAGHRYRIDEKSRLMGLDFLEEHEQLEKLLFSVIPRGNTNGIAHNLLKEFGSLYGVLSADTEQLKAIDGIGNRTAEFLHDLPQLLGIVERSMHTCSENPVLDTTEKMGNYAKTLFYGKVTEQLYMVSLNSSMRVIRFNKISEGTATVADISLHRIAKFAIMDEAYAVFLAHNHPGGRLSPSPTDFSITRDVINGLQTLDITLADHFIVASNQWFSIKTKTKGL